MAIDLFTAVALGKTDYVKKLLKEKPALSATKNAEGTPALCEAVKFNQKEVLAALLDAGSPVGDTDDSGYTALHWAAFWGREEIAKLLIDRKADVNAAAKSGFTPLHESARLATPAVAKLLLAHGAKVNARDDRGFTPLSWAQENANRTEENGAKVPEVVRQTIELLRKNGGTK